MYLLDTNVVSELRRSRPHGAVLAWLGGIADADLHLSAMTIGETQAGIEIACEQDEAEATELEAWLEQVARTYNVLPVNGRTFRVRARLMHRRPDHPIGDALIAATAQVHRLTLVTRNVRDFAPFAIPLLDPFAARRAR